MCESEINYIKTKFKNAGLTLSSEKAAVFYRFYEKLIEKNKVMNLTAITEFEEVVRKHFIDSVLNVDIKNCSRVLDIGTGAGFPGIPLKIMYPDIKITLLDSLNKRVEFLKECVDDLNMTNIECIHARAEDLARKDEYREKYDYVCSRAVSSLSTLAEYSLPYLKTGGIMISYKSGSKEEIKNAERALKILGGDFKNIRTIDFNLPEGDEKRSLIYIRKIKATPGKYPRKAGTPAKDPL